MAAGKTAMRATARRVKPWPAGNTGRQAASWGYLTINLTSNRRPFKSASPLPLICRCSLSAEPLPSKQMERVQLPSAAPRAFARHNYSKNPVRKEATVCTCWKGSQNTKPLWFSHAVGWIRCNGIPAGSDSNSSSGLPFCYLNFKLSIVFDKIMKGVKTPSGNFSSALRG